VAVYNNLAPEWWDGEEWDFSVQTEGSDNEAPLTDGEADLQFLVEGELEEESADDAFSWGEDLSPTEYEAEASSEDKTSSDEYPPMKRFRAGSWDDSDDDDKEDGEDEDEVSIDRYHSGDEYFLDSADEGDDGDDERAGSEDEESSGSSSDSEEESSSGEDGSDGDGSDGDGSDGEGSAVC
jgi:hypothetical protein